MVAKRKLNSHTLCIDPKKNLGTPKKPPTKADIANELKIMKQLNEALEEENRHNLNKIKDLEDRLIQLESERNASDKKKKFADKHCQTESELIFCYECEFPADDFHDLGEHMIEYHFEGECKLCDETFTTKEKLADHMSDDHQQDLTTQDLGSVKFICNHCEQSFASKSNLMVHKKQHHIEMIDTCWGFVAGNCVFGDKKCWFRHSPTKLSDIKCKLCTENFETKPEYMKHRKEKHETVVPICQNSSSCKYEFCWFIHKGTDENEIPNEIEEMENNVVIERLFDLVEKLGERIKKLEQKT